MISKNGFQDQNQFLLDSVVFAFSRDCAKNEHPIKEIYYCFIRLRNHDLSKVENSFTGWNSPQKPPGEKPHGPWGSQKWFFTCQGPKISAQDDWLQIDEVSIS